jgi:hypothetical protein
MEEWRATIQSLIGFTNKDGPQEAGPSQRQSIDPTRADVEKTGGGATTVHSPP